MQERWYFFQAGCAEPAQNMAWDEVLLQTAPDRARPVVRFYGWTHPAATFGYFQKYAEIERMTKLRPLIRRPTGGGLVPHAADWTYSLVFPPLHPWYLLSAVESYQRVHEWIQAAFQSLGLPTVLSPVSLQEIPGQCFAGAERFDLICGERKIAGAAQRRSRRGLLIQGSLQPVPAGISRTDWERAFCKEAELGRGIEWIAFEEEIELKERVKVLAGEKYSRASYNQKR
jgi:lipoate-protein ligase A